VPALTKACPCGSLSFHTGEGRVSKRTIAIVGLLVVTTIWGSAYAITKAALTQLPPITFALLRFLVASAVLSVLCYPRRKHLYPLLHSQWLLLLLMGLTGITLYYLGYQFGLVYGSATQGAFIQAPIPAATAVTAVLLLHERLSKLGMAGIGVSFLGVILVILGTPADALAPSPLLGALCMAGSTVAWALYTICAKRLTQANALVITTVSTVIGTMLLVPFSLVEMQLHPLPLLTPPDWLSILYLGTLSSAGCYLLYNWSLVHLDASQAANFLNLVPIVAVAIAILFLGEGVVLAQLLGGALVLLGVWLTTQSGSVRNAELVK
jgi:drug/metabolite transporter (DMT)-like permease